MEKILVALDKPSVNGKANEWSRFGPSATKRTEKNKEWCALMDAAQKKVKGHWKDFLTKVMLMDFA